MSRIDDECTGELREFNSPAMRVNSQLVWDSYLLRLYELLVSVLYLWARTMYTTGLPVIGLHI